MNQLCRLVISSVYENSTWVGQEEFFYSVLDFALCLMSCSVNDSIYKCIYPYICFSRMLVMIVLAAIPEGDVGPAEGR